MQTSVPFNMFDEEFKTNMKGAQILSEKLDQEEKSIALSWMRRLINLQANDISIKKDRNHFLKKLLEVMKQSVIQRVLSNSKSSELSSTEKEKLKVEVSKVCETLRMPLVDRFLVEKSESSRFMSMWSSDRRTYVAAKPIPGRGALVYMAVSEKPELGWTIPNQGILDKE